MNFIRYIIENGVGLIIEILSIGGLTTIQDLGRRGYQKFGVSVGGVMDEVSARLANYIVGNEDNDPVLEFAMSGPVIRFLHKCVFGIGGSVNAKLNGVPIDTWRSYFANSGDILEIGIIREGVYGYIAFAGGIKCKRIMGSCSTYLRAGFGEPLKSGSVLYVNNVSLKNRDGNRLPEEFIPRYAERKIKVVLGPHLENFTEKGIKTFLDSEYTVTLEADRMGYRLKGPPIEHSPKGADILTDAIPLGSIQVPASGNPIIMMADRPTTGGYAKIAVVATVDIPKVAQTPPGNKLRFESISLEKAQELLKKRENTMKALKMFLEGRLRAFRIKISQERFTIFLKEC